MFGFKTTRNDNSLKDTIKIKDIRLKGKKMLKDGNAPDKVKINFNKYEIKKDMKVDIKFNINRKKNKIKTEFSFTNGFRKFGGYVVSGLVTAVIAVSICGAVNALGYRFGSEVIIDGETIGLVVNREEAYTVIDQIRQELLSYSNGEVQYQKKPTFIGRIVGQKDITSADEMKNRLMSHVDYLVEACGILLNNEIQVAVINEEAADFVLEQHKKKYSNQKISDDDIVIFDKEVAVKKQFVPVSLLRTAEGALDLLSKVYAKDHSFISTEENTLWDVAKLYNMSIDRIKELNSHIVDDVIEVGSVINVEINTPMLGVTYTHNIEYNEEKPFEVEKVNDEDLYKGRINVIKEGSPGENRVIARIKQYNGVEIERDILSVSIVKEPETRIESHGIKEPPPTLATGTFLRPAYGSLSSRYGARWGRQHKGIDIAGSYGSDIKAADGGLVTFSGWESGYGNFIIIDHENGYSTAYGHCSSLVVKKGDRVAKGDVIAKMGNSGNSTGTHLHFEVKKDGVQVNPSSYVNY